jgi:EAL domain-containing protein (putative c-di-GMP-specific phosphodiesterase class I)
LSKAYLEHYQENHGPAQIVEFNRFPFHVGRSEKADLSIYSCQVSKHHAVIDCRGGRFGLRDLGSTNGTFVNGQRVTESPLRDGDIIHFAHKEFRFSVISLSTPLKKIEIETTPMQKGLPISVICGRQALQEVLLRQLVRVVFQPIVDLQTQSNMGYEALGRGTHEELSQSPAQLFHLAEKCGLATHLSRLFRLVALREVHAITGPSSLFFNVHPAEMDDFDFLNSLGEVDVRPRAGQQMVMEVHENSVCDVSAMRRLRDRLHELGIGLAFDDFGAGQARLAELADAPPDFLKIDMKLIRGIDRAPSRQHIVGSLTELCSRLGVRVLAEGIETAEEADCCRRLGCHWGQGFLFGSPAALTPSLPPRPKDTKHMDLRPLREMLR